MSNKINPELADLFCRKINKYFKKAIISKEYLCTNYDNKTLRCALYFWSKYSWEPSNEGYDTIGVVIYSVANSMNQYYADKKGTIPIKKSATYRDFNAPTKYIKDFIHDCYLYTRDHPAPKYNETYEEILGMPYEEAKNKYSVKRIKAAQQYKKDKLMEEISGYEAHINTLNKQISELNKEIDEYKSKIDEIESEIKKI